MGGINFGWLALRVLSPHWLSRKLEVCDFLPGAYVKPPRLGKRSPGRARLCEFNPGICLTTEGKSRKNLSRGIRKALGRTELHLMWAYIHTYILS